MNFLCKEDLTPESVVKVLEELAAGRKPKPGPQSTRQSSEPPYGPGEHCVEEFR
ncbi:hypothetical protein Pst134EB_014317 [Puccinia striiformis f. sp. tritici]|nr:hypothetical protein Pst134EB_014317 [Puccinia striiformis f. sp. tritici]